MLSARRSLSLFLAGVVGLACWQVWLTWRVTEQDSNLETERSHQRLEQIGDLAVAELARSLGDWDLALRELSSLPPSSSLMARLLGGASLMLISSGSVAVYPPTPLLFVPDPPRAAAASRAFDEADELELREEQYDRAIAALQPLINQPATRAEALLRTARIQRKAGQPEASLETYQRLAREASALVPALTGGAGSGGAGSGGAGSGGAYALQAANARCRILIDLGRRDQASAEAQSLRGALLEGRWPLSRETFDYYWNGLDSFGITAGQPSQSSLDFAALVSNLYDRWQRSTPVGTTASVREQQPDSSLLMWNLTPQRLTALVTSPGWLESSFKLPANSSDVRWKLLAPNVPSAGGMSVTRSLGEAQLPGRLEFSSLAPRAGVASSRRALWVAGVILMVMLVLVSGYAVHRGVSRESQVAKLQSDFVAAVSHEFRSPLTTLRTITELLAQDRITDESRRRQSYSFLDRETNRLHRLVEDLLDFGRMESGRKQYRMEPHDAFGLVRAAVADFSQEAAANGFCVETNLASVPATVQADEEALRRAVRNLLENAMKYSPECRTVWVEGAVSDHRVSIAVRDQGMGIEPREQRAIFQKFVRGNAAKKAGIKGTGIGLSMVLQISEALGGEVRLESKVGVGSTFTLMLPLVDNGDGGGLGGRRRPGACPTREVLPAE